MKDKKEPQLTQNEKNSDSGKKFTDLRQKAESLLAGRKEANPPEI